MPKQAIILVSSQNTSTCNQFLPQRIADSGRQDLDVLDVALVPGSKQSSSLNTILLSGRSSSTERAASVLNNLSDTIFTVPGGFGAASKVALVHQLLSGLHVATAAEAMGLAAKAGLDTKATYDIISNAAGSSSAFNTRVPAMLEGNFNPRTTLGSSRHSIVR